MVEVILLKRIKTRGKWYRVEARRAGGRGNKTPFGGWMSAGSLPVLGTKKYKLGSKKKGDPKGMNNKATLIHILRK